MEIMEAIKQKCIKNCGMRQAWPEGVCRAGEACALYEYSPLREFGTVARPEAPAQPEVYEDL